MAKNKKRKPHKTRPATVVRDIPSILYRKITCKYLANMDTFQVYVDMIMNGTVLRLLGNIDPNSSYTEGIRIFTNFRLVKDTRRDCSPYSLPTPILSETY